MTAPEIKQHFKSLAWLWRHATSVAVILGTLWVFSGPFIKSYANDALVETLKEIGVDPESIKQTHDSNKEQERDLDKIKSELTAVQKTLSEVSGDIEETKNSVGDIKDLVRDLNNALLNRRSGINLNDMAPFPEGIEQ